MRRFTIILTVLAIGAMATPAALAQGGGGNRGGGNQGGGGLRQRMVDRFDANDDGQLSDDEWAQARKALSRSGGRGRGGPSAQQRDGSGKKGAGKKGAAKKGPGKKGPGGKGGHAHGKPGAARGGQGVP